MQSLNAIIDLALDRYIVIANYSPIIKIDEPFFVPIDVTYISLPALFATDYGHLANVGNILL